MKATVCCAVVCVSALVAASSQPAPPAPVPGQILAAKKIFVGNAGADSGYFPELPFSGEPERAYNTFYAAMKTWGHYQLVGAPSDADLLMEIRLKILGRGQPSYWDGEFRLTIREPQTNALLWTIVEPVDDALLQSNRDKNFDQALARIVADLQRLTPPSTFGDSNSP